MICPPPPIKRGVTWCAAGCGADVVSPRARAVSSGGRPAILAGCFHDVEVCMAVQTESVIGEPAAPLDCPELADAVAWWLLTGKGSPSDLVTRFIYAAPDGAEQRQKVAAQVRRLLEVAETIGIGDELKAVFWGVLKTDR